MNEILVMDETLIVVAAGVIEEPVILIDHKMNLQIIVPLNP